MLRDSSTIYRYDQRALLKYYKLKWVVLSSHSACDKVIRCFHDVGRSDGGEGNKLKTGVAAVSKRISH